MCKLGRTGLCIVLALGPAVMALQAQIGNRTQPTGALALEDNAGILVCERVSDLWNPGIYSAGTLQQNAFQETGSGVITPAGTITWNEAAEEGRGPNQYPDQGPPGNRVQRTGAAALQGRTGSLVWNAAGELIYPAGACSP
jgi:hypothetical protein